ncbi:aldehyde ferredoxin oxidoreductase family protein [Chloroflexota bacterium]
MAYGYNGAILRVDLEQGITSVEHPDDTFYRRYLGGRGFIYYYLLKELEAGVDPLGPQNKLILATGVVTGAPLGGNARSSVGAKSPLTGGAADSQVGGYFGQELKRAGLDAVIIEGRAPSPVYLWIHDGGVEIRDAAHLWGKLIGESQREIALELGEPHVRTAQIGPGGENLVRYACVINDCNHAAGRGGLGAVMGSKNLKAIAVRGQKRPRVADPKAVQRHARWLAQTLETRVLHELGTAWLVMFANEQGRLPTRNFQEGVFAAAEKISGEAMHKSIVQSMDTCYACPVACMPRISVQGACHVDPVYGGPQFEGLAMLGSNCGIDDIEVVAKANEMCNANTIDVISTGAAVSFAMECFEKGILTEEDTGGLELNFGNAGAMLSLIQMIVDRRGIGDLLAEGLKTASERIGQGSADWAAQVKNQGVPAMEPRQQFAVGLGYAVSSTGADHGKGFLGHGYAHPGPGLDKYKAVGILEPVPLNDSSPARIRASKYLAHWRSFLDSVLMCSHLPYGYQQMADIVNAVTGWNATVWELLKAGERTETMARAFNAREGMTRARDVLPARFSEPLLEGACRGLAIDRSQMDEAVITWYKMMGWDIATGKPLPETLDELDIGWVKDLI